MRFKSSVQSSSLVSGASLSTDAPVAKWRTIGSTAPNAPYVVTKPDGSAIIKTAAMVDEDSEPDEVTKGKGGKGSIDKHDDSSRNKKRRQSRSRSRSYSRSRSRSAGRQRRKYRGRSHSRSYSRLVWQNIYKFIYFIFNSDYTIMMSIKRFPISNHPLGLLGDSFMYLVFV